MSAELAVASDAIRWPAVADKEALTQAIAPANVRRLMMDRTTALACYQAQAPTLASIRREQGEKYCTARVAEYLLSIENYLGDKMDMSKAQYIEIAEDIMNEFYVLNIADINLVVQRIKHGEYGKVYGKISCAYIYDAFRNYYQERSDAVAESHKASEESIAKHGYDRTTAPTATEEQVAELYQKYRQAYEVKKEQEAQIHLSAQVHLKEVLTTFKKHVKNGTKENM